MPKADGKYDPLQQAVKADAPEGLGNVDPLGSLLSFFKDRSSMKYISKVTL